MPRERSRRRLRSWYEMLLRLYPKHFRERFAEAMEQTFDDLLRERADQGSGLLTFTLWVSVETFAAAMRENMATLQLPRSTIARIAFATAFVLSVPLLAMQFTDQVAWDLADFAVAGALLFGAGLAFVLVARKARQAAYRSAAGVAIAAALLLVWMNLAVGIIGSERNPANLMYIAVLAVGAGGAFAARFQAQGMAWAMGAAAIAQALVAVIAMFAHPDANEHLNLLLVTGFFMALFAGSALLFRRAAKQQLTADR